MLSDVERPVLLLDWSNAAEEFQALTTAVAGHGRSPPISRQVHLQECVGDVKVQKRYVNALAGILPTGGRPIQVFDAGFGNPFYKAVTKHDELRDPHA